MPVGPELARESGQLGIAEFGHNPPLTYRSATSATNLLQTLVLGWKGSHTVSR